MRHPFFTIFLVWFCTVFLAFGNLAWGATPERSTYGALVRLGSHYTDHGEPESLRDHRRNELANAVDKATKRKSERALLLSVGWFESRFAGYVLAYKCSDGPGKEKECDKGKASGPWQLHQAPSYDLEADARVALDRLRAAKRYCKQDTWEAALSLYATGKSCTWKGAAERVALMQKIEGWL